MRSTRAATRLAWSLWALALALTALALWLFALNLSRPGVHAFDYWLENTLLAVVFTTAGALIAARRPANPFSWVFCTVGLLGALRHAISQYVIYALLAAPGSLPAAGALTWVAYWLWVPHLGLMIFIPLLFPDGRLPSRRWRWVAWSIVAVVLVGTISAAFSSVPLFPGLGPIHNPLASGAAGGRSWLALTLSGALVLWGALLLIAAASMFVRLRRARGVERQQLKWFTYAAALAIGGAVLRYVLSATAGVAWAWWAGLALVTLGLLVLAIAIAVAILRYHLYDIDVVIHRTLVYGALTGTLALLYVGLVAALQSGVRALTGAQSDLAIVASTLGIAALFQPLRRRIQAFVDRRFYRRTYDAQRTLALFGARLRDETDLERLSADLLAVVQEAMQPAHVSLWLRPPERKS